MRVYGIHQYSVVLGMSKIGVFRRSTLIKCVDLI